MSLNFLIATCREGVWVREIYRIKCRRCIINKMWKLQLLRLPSIIIIMLLKLSAYNLRWGIPQLSLLCYIFIDAKIIATRYTWIAGNVVVSLEKRLWKHFQSDSVVVQIHIMCANVYQQIKRISYYNNYYFCYWYIQLVTILFLLLI